jgi:hypothetical protein
MANLKPRKHIIRLTVELSRDEVRALKTRTGKKTASAALKAWVSNADARHCIEQLKTALSNSRDEQPNGKGRAFKSGRDAVRWLEN